MACVIGIDLGTSSVKVLAVDEKGQIRATATEHYPLLQPLPGFAEQDPKEWWGATCTAVRKTVQQLAAEQITVSAVGFSGQMHGLVLLDDQLEVVRPAILWCDQRTEQQCEWIESIFDSNTLWTEVGNPVLTGFTAPKLRWVEQHEPANYRRIRHVMLPKDYIRFRLTNVLGTDVSDASGTLWLDIERRDWSQPVLEALGVPQEFLPPVYESAQVTGEVTTQAAAHTSLPAGIPVVAGAGDQAAGAIGTGVLQSGIASLALGTSGVVFAPSTKYPANPGNRLHRFCHAEQKLWHTMGVMLTASGSLEWWKNTIGDAVQERAAGEGRSQYEVLLSEAAEAAPGSDGLLFLPYLMGERTPYPDPSARAGFIGLTSRHTLAHLSRAVIEGVSYGMRDILELVKEAGAKVDSLRVSGGGAQSPLWRQILADLTQTPVDTVNTVDAPALGACLLALTAIRPGSTLEEICKEVIQVTDRAEPDAERGRIYEAYYQEYRSLYPMLKATFQRLSSLSIQR